MHRLLLLLACAFLILGNAADAHDGWSRSKLVQRSEELLGKKVELSPVSGLPGSLFLLDPTEDASCFMGTGDRAWAFAAGEFSQVVLIGSEHSIHTLWVYFPVVSVRDTDAAFAFFEGLFGELFPNWTEATGWAQKSLSEAWGKGAEAYRDPMISFDEMIARVAVDGTLLATSGVPPDLVTYRITTRTECEKISKYLLAKPRRAICDPNRVIPDDAFRQVLLYRTRPEPIDRSETPFFLGNVRAQRLGSEPLDFDLPGGLQDGALDWNGWFAEQAQGDLSLGQILTEDWACAQHFTYSVSSPDIAPEATSSWLLSVESMSAYAVRAPGDVAYDPQVVSGLLFSRTAPTVPPRPPSPEPPYMLVNEGDMVFDTEGDPVPVDISEVPFHLGQVFIGYGRTSFPAQVPMDGQVQDLSLVLTSRRTGAVNAIDLAAWLDRQTLPAPAPDRARPITDPVLDFTIDGRRFKLILTSVDFDATDGQPFRISGFSGNLFASG